MVYDKPVLRAENSRLSIQEIADRVSNTRSFPQNGIVEAQSQPVVEPRMDYYSGTAWIPNMEIVYRCFDEVASACSCQLAYEPERQRSFGEGQHFQHSGRTTKGGLFAYTPDESRGGFKVWLSLPGTHFYEMDLSRQLFFICLVTKDYRFKATRLDSKIRDFARRITADKIRAHKLRKEISRNPDVRFSSTINKNLEEHITTYIGSKHSDSIVCIYDAMPVHGVDAIDWEARFRSEKAEACVNSICEWLENRQPDFDEPVEGLEQAFGQVLAAHALGAVDFLEPPTNASEAKNASRRPRLPWFQNFIDEVGGFIRIYIPIKVRTFQRSIKWLRHQVVTTVAMLQDASGSNFTTWFEEQVKKSRDRYTAYHKALIRDTLIENAGAEAVLTKRQKRRIFVHI